MPFDYVILGAHILAPQLLRLCLILTLKFYKFRLRATFGFLSCIVAFYSLLGVS